VPGGQHVGPTLVLYAARYQAAVTLLCGQGSVLQHASEHSLPQSLRFASLHTSMLNLQLRSLDIGSSREFLPAVYI
jgi:hypothetical protein